MYISGHPLDDYKTEIQCFCNASLDVLRDLNKLEGMDLSLAGVVSDVQHRVSKNGKGWAAFTLEDFSESYEFRIFNEDYLKFRHFLVPNTFLYLKTKMARAWRDGEVRIQFLAMQQLQDVMKHLAKKITVHLDVQQINPSKVDHLKALTKRFAGDKRLDFLVYDADEQIKINMPSRGVKVEITKELLDELKAFELNFKLN